MIDTTFTYKTGYNVYGADITAIQKEAFCRLRVNGRVAIAPALTCQFATELPNSGKSITNAAEELAEQICQYYEILPTRLILIEHYPSDGSAGEEFSLVRFLFSESRLVNPRWRSISKVEAIQRLRTGG